MSTAPEGRTWLAAARIVTLIGALGIVAIGAVGGSMGVLVAILGPGEAALSSATVAVSLFALACGLGSVLAWHAWRATQGQESAPLLPRRSGAWIVLYLITIAGGQLLLSTGSPAKLVFPLFHVVAAVLPAWMIVSLVARKLDSASTWRGVVLQLGSGAFVSTSLAILVEGIVLVALLVALVGIYALQPDGLDLVRNALDRLQDPGWVEDTTALAPLARSPVFVGLVLFAAAGIVPLIEEAVKTVGVGLRSYRRPTLAQAFLWGVACGAGFAVAEALFNAAGGLQAWGLVITLRIGATVLHCLTGGLMGIAWYLVISERRRLAAIGLYAASVTVHALWNGLSIGVLLLSVGSAGAAASAFGSMGVLTFMSMLVSVAVAMSVVLWWLAGSVRSRSATGILQSPAARALLPDPREPQGQSAASDDSSLGNTASEDGS